MGQRKMIRRMTNRHQREKAPQAEARGQSAEALQEEIVWVAAHEAAMKGLAHLSVPALAACREAAALHLDLVLLLLNREGRLTPPTLAPLDESVGANSPQVHLPRLGDGPLDAVVIQADPLRNGLRLALAKACNLSGSTKAANDVI
jgi:hypothetical protein